MLPSLVLRSLVLPSLVLRSLSVRSLVLRSLSVRSLSVRSLPLPLGTGCTLVTFTQLLRVTMLQGLN